MDLTCTNCKKVFSLHGRTASKRSKSLPFCTQKCCREWQSTNLRITEDRTRKCSQCGHEGDSIEFYIRKQRKSAFCRPCFSSYMIRRYNSRKLACIEFLGGKCSECNGKFHPSVFNFHHVDPKIKKFDWGKLKIQSVKTVADEIRKCVLICSNCHSKEHSGEQGWEGLEQQKEDFLNKLRQAS